MPNVFVPQITFLCSNKERALYDSGWSRRPRAARRESIIGDEIRFLEISDSWNAFIFSGALKVGIDLKVIHQKIL